MISRHNLDEMTEDIIPYAELEDSSSSDESNDDLEVTVIHLMKKVIIKKTKIFSLI